MEALKDQQAQLGGNTATLTRAGRPETGRTGMVRPEAGRLTGSAAAIAACVDSALPAAAVLAQAHALVNTAATRAPGSLAMAGYVEAADFAGEVEELSRTVEYLQILTAGAVDRTRTQAIADAARSRSTRSWVTGWDNGTETLNETGTAWPAGPPAATAGTAGTAANGPANSQVPASPPVPASPADDGCANTAEFLRLRLRIGKAEAHRRLSLARAVLPAATATGETTPPPREHLATALTPGPTVDASASTARDPRVPWCTASAPAVSSRAGTIITLTLDRLQHFTTPETLSRIEQDLTRTAATTDPDFLARVARHWSEAIDADGAEPSEEALRRTQGAFIRKPHHGLHHLEIFATTDQYEHLLTVMNAATNPRTQAPLTGTPTPTPEAVGTPSTGTENSEHGWGDTGSEVELDRRTRSQKQLDGIISAVKAALTTDLLPVTGGSRPQILATIHYQDLLAHLHAPSADTSPGAGEAITGKPVTGTGNYVFTGPVAASTLRKLACDADIIPALLGTNGEILDLGRKTRLFTPAQRLALTARDQGCTFPNCTIPAPWCEAHHITYWSRNGPTSTSNGALLCSHHHHLIHKEQWTITTRDGIPLVHTPTPHRPQPKTPAKPLLQTAPATPGGRQGSLGAAGLELPAAGHPAASATRPEPTRPGAPATLQEGASGGRGGGPRADGA